MADASWAPEFAWMAFGGDEEEKQLIAGEMHKVKSTSRGEIADLKEMYPDEIENDAPVTDSRRSVHVQDRQDAMEIDGLEDVLGSFKPTFELNMRSGFLWTSLRNSGTQ